MTELEVFKQSLDVSRATLIVSLIVSLSSIVFASLQMAFQRSHDIKSLRPLCALEARSSAAGVSVHLRNVGLGPLVLGSIALSREAGAAAEGPRLPASAAGGRIIPPLEDLKLLDIAEGELASYEGAVLEIDYRDIYDRRREASLPLGPVLAAAER